MGPDHDIDKLAKNIKGLVAEIDKYTGDKRWNVLLELIYKKGWTTPAEYRFVNGIVTNMHDQIRVLAKLQDTLMEGSQAVLEKNVTRK